MTEPTASDLPRVDGIPVPQLLSFLTHDIYGPTSMLRTYLRAVADSTENEETRTQLADAESLSGQVESMLRLLRNVLSLASGTLEVERQPIRLASFLFQLVLANTTLHRQDQTALDDDTRIVADERLLAAALEGVAWQMARMGVRQGPMAVGVLSADRDRVEVGLWRTDEPLDGDLLERALAGRDEDWMSFLRRLPACGFPLRVAKRLLSVMGGEVGVRRELGQVVLAFPARTPPL